MSLFAASTVAQIPPNKHESEPIRREGTCDSHEDEFRSKGTWLCAGIAVPQTAVSSSLFQRTIDAVNEYTKNKRIGNVKTILEGVGSDPDCDSGKARCEAAVVYLPGGAVIKDVRYFWLARNGDDAGHWLTSPADYDAAWGRIGGAKYQLLDDGTQLISSVCANWSDDQQFRCALGVLYTRRPPQSATFRCDATNPADQCAFSVESNGRYINFVLDPGKSRSVSAVDGDRYCVQVKRKPVPQCSWPDCYAGRVVKSTSVNN
jgi:hypothetical protein